MTKRYNWRPLDDHKYIFAFICKDYQLIQFFYLENLLKFYLSS